MTRIINACILFFLFTGTYAQIAGKINRVENPAKINSVEVGSISNLAGVSVVIPYKNCSKILQNNPGAPDGVYTIDPDGSGPVEAFDCYCDMTTDGGGWTLVLLSNADVTGCPRPYWDEALNNINLVGTFSSDLASFDLFMGVSYWNTMGTEARLDMGASSSSLDHRAYYDFSLDESNNYALSMSNESITIGSTSPGMFEYHNGRPLSTRDRDNDAYSSNCSMNYYESAWWYGACWSGSFWGGGLEILQDAPYWTGMAEYFDYGAIWLR